MQVPYVEVAISQLYQIAFSVLVVQVLLLWGINLSFLTPLSSACLLCCFCSWYYIHFSILCAVYLLFPYEHHCTSFSVLYRFKRIRVYQKWGGVLLLPLIPPVHYPYSVYIFIYFVGMLIPHTSPFNRFETRYFQRLSPSKMFDL